MSTKLYPAPVAAVKPPQSAYTNTTGEYRAAVTQAIAAGVAAMMGKGAGK